MKKNLLLTSLFAFALIPFFGLSQAPSNPNSDNKELEKLIIEFQKQYDLEQIRVKEFAKKYNIPLSYETPDGGIVILDRISASGVPEFKSTLNTNAAKTVKTNHVQAGGRTNLNLTGAGYTIAQWDGGRVRTTHQEFTTNRVTQIDGSTTLSAHATHVAGTMVARGASTNGAQGMATAATLRAFDFSNDVTEMAQEANTGLKLSNHSYGTPAGFNYNSSLNRWEWLGDENISMVTDYRFGYYDNTARNWDQIAVNAPFYLMVKSAGNDRNDYTSGTHWVFRSGNWVSTTQARNADGPYDCLSTYSCSKNILSVGSVLDIPNGYVSSTGVIISSFSSGGPTDDGRIKPDIVGNGQDLYSCNSTADNAYYTSQGTSMSSPNVTGSIALLNSFYFSKYARHMRSSTTKALVLHTADEAGPGEGPDYTFGWGLMNTERAALLIADSLDRNPIFEKTLGNKDTMMLNLYSNGIEPLRVTIAWIDPAGNVSPPALNNRAIKLINDLDLRIIDSVGTEYMPYKLNYNSPAAAATKGDNLVDNVEQVYIAAPAAGNYRVRVTHKGNLAGNSPQAFSMVISGSDNPRIANFSTSNTNGCMGLIVQYFDKSTFNGATYSWSFPGGISNTTTQQNPTVLYNVPGTYAVSLTITDGANVKSVTKTNFITINANPDITNVTSNNNSCNKNGKITLAVSGGAVPYNYLWNPSTLNLPDTNVASGLDANTYIVFVQDKNGCRDTATVVLTYTGPDVNVTPTDIKCYGQTNGTATAIGSGGAAPYIYTWNTTPTQTGASISNMSKGNYICTVKDNNNCTFDKSFTIVEPDTIAIQIYSFGNGGIGQGSVLINVSGGTPNYRYQWSTGPNDTNQIVNNLMIGSYSCIVTDNNGCTKSGNVVVTSIGEQIGKYIQVFPNPTNGLVNINISLLAEENVSYLITDQFGRIVKTGVYNKVGKANNIVDLSREAQGIYFVKISSDKWSLTKKISLIKE